MNNRAMVRVSGEYALFTRPEHQPDRYSYDLITPSAARGALQAIHWKPEIDYDVRRLYVCKRGGRVDLMRNEVKSRMTKPKPPLTVLSGIDVAGERERVQRNRSFLRHVE